MGGGDALMSLLGVVIISFGFRVYTQRDTMKRHFPEIVGATILSSIFSLFSTAFAAKAIGLSAGGCELAANRSQGGVLHICMLVHPAGLVHAVTVTPLQRSGGRHVWLLPISALRFAAAQHSTPRC